VNRCRRLPGVRDEHPYDAFARVLAEGDAAQLERALGGRRVAIFGRVDLSPEQFALFGRLAGSIDVSIFAPDPCRELWSDLLDPASLARVRAQRPDEAWLYDGEPSILGSWGRAHRDFVAQLLDLEERFGVQAEAPGRDEPLPFDSRDTRGDAPTALQALHASVFLRSDAPWRALRGLDDSIRIVGTHGPVREAETLHEILLECFATMPGLAPADVVVHCADIETAAPAIEGVFESVPAERRIPLAISGRLRGIDPAIDAVEAIVGAAVHGIDAARLDALLRNPALAEALSLDESEVDALLDGLMRAGARRGLDAHGGASKHNLQAATDRLLLGAAIGAEQVCGDLLAVPGAQGTRARALDGWLALAEALGRLRALASRPRPPREWCEALGDLVEVIFARSRAQAAVQRLREAIDRLAASGDEAAGVVLDAAAFARAFADAIAQGAPAAVPGGAVTVVPIGSLRGVPYRVVCLFGFDERSFPDAARATRSTDAPRARVSATGSCATTTRAFLEAELAARERLSSPAQPRCARRQSAEPVAARRGTARLAVGAPGRRRARRAGVDPSGAARRGERRAGARRVSIASVLATQLRGRACRSGERVAGNRAGGEHTAREPCRGDRRALRRRCGSRRSFRLRCRLRSRQRDRRAERRRLRARCAAARVPRSRCDRADRAPAPCAVRSGTHVARRVAGRHIAGGRRRAARTRAAVAAIGARRAAGPALRRAPARRRRACAPRARAAMLAGHPRRSGRRDRRRGGRRAGAVADRACTGRPHEHRRARRGTRCAARAASKRAGGRARRSATAHVAAGARFAWTAFVSAYPLGPHSLIDAWLRTALWRFAVDSAATGRLITPDQAIVVNCDYALRALEHAIEWSRRISTQPLALFPRSWLCHARERLRGKRPDLALERAQAALAGDENGFRTPELARPAMRALYRDAEIDFEQVLPLCERVYRPMIDDTSLTGSAEAEGAAS